MFMTIINFLMKYNIFTLISYVSTLTLIIRALRQEYLLWKGVKVFDEEEDYQAMLQEVTKKATTGVVTSTDINKKLCPHCGQKLPRNFNQKKMITKERKRMCNKVMIYFYILLFIVLFVVFVSVLGFAAVFPAYSVFVKPFISTTQVVNPQSINSTTLLNDIVYNQHIPIDDIPLNGVYKDLVVFSSEEGIDLVKNCSSVFPPLSEIKNLTSEIFMFIKSNEQILSKLPEYGDLLKKTTLAPLLKYIPSSSAHLYELFLFIESHPYESLSKQTVHDFFNQYPILLDSIYDITIYNLTDKTFMTNLPYHIFKDSFIHDFDAFYKEASTNVTIVSGILKNSTTEITSFASHLIHGDDISLYEQIPKEIRDDLITLIQYIYKLYDILYVYYNAVPTFSTCAANYLNDETDTIKQWAYHQYFSFFYRRFFFTLLILIILGGCLFAIGYLIKDSITLFKNTMEYTRDELKKSTEMLKNEANNATGGILFGVDTSVPPVEFSSDDDDDADTNVPLYIKKRK
ncbi:hypothetical protein WA158_000873 [Blastocystis sp. Blastoise]